MNTVVFLSLISLLTAVVLSVNSPVHAEGLSYRYASIDYIRSSINVDTVPESLVGNGYSVNLSFAARPYISLMAGYDAHFIQADTATSSIDAEVDAYLLGFIIHAEINDSSDFIVGAAFINGVAHIEESNMKARSVDADGGMSIIGFRALVRDNLEVKGFVRKNSIEDEATISLLFGVDYYIRPTLSLDLGYLVDVDKGSDHWSLGITTYY
jgi:hypothetical protein